MPTHESTDFCTDFNCSSDISPGEHQVGEHVQYSETGGLKQKLRGVENYSSEHRKREAPAGAQDGGLQRRGSNLACDRLVSNEGVKCVCHHKSCVSGSITLLDRTWYWWLFLRVLRATRYQLLRLGSVFKNAAFPSIQKAILGKDKNSFIIAQKEGKLACLNLTHCTCTSC